MNQRIRMLRKEILHLTLEKFGERLGVKKAAVSKWENGDNVSEQMIKAICREFDINENWLRTGEGEPRTPLTRKQAIADFMADCLKDEEDSFRNGFIEALAALSVENWKVIEKIVTTAANRHRDMKKD